MSRRLRVAFLMPSLHRVDRGAEVALESVATRLGERHDVTLIGSGKHRPGKNYNFVHSGSVDRKRFENFPHVPVFRSNYVYEEATWVPGLLVKYKPKDFDVVVHCTYPFTNWAIRLRNKFGGGPPLVYVTQNGDWPAFSEKLEYKLFKSDGLVCINPLYMRRNASRWNTQLIPNGADLTRFHPGDGERETFGLPADVPIALMVSALVDSKRVLEAMNVVARVPDLHFVVAGDGPLRGKVDALAEEILPGRFSRINVPFEEMPALYRSANVFVHGSQWESFGNVYVEALASGLPVVADDNEVSRWIIGDNGYLVDTDDAAAFANALRAALASGADEIESRVEVARSRFDWDVIAGEYEEFLFSLTGPRDEQLID